MYCVLVENVTPEIKFGAYASVEYCISSAAGPPKLSFIEIASDLALAWLTLGLSPGSGIHG